MRFRQVLFLVLTYTSLTCFVTVQGRDVLRGILQDIGKEQLDKEMAQILEYARSLRQDQPGAWVGPFHEGGRSIVRKICFSDGVCWAAKMGTITFVGQLTTSFGVRSLKALSEHCPYLPVPRVFSDTQTSAHLLYTLMSWVDGVGLSRQIPTLTSGPHIEHIPDNLIVQLATFFYNLTTCPIPEMESKFSQDSF